MAAIVPESLAAKDHFVEKNKLGVQYWNLNTQTTIGTNKSPCKSK